LEQATACPRWSVKDIATHLLGGQLGILSRKRDAYAYSGNPIKNWDELVVLINNLNEIWVKAASRLSPRLLCDLLKLSGEQVCDYFNSLHPYAIGGPVDWAGPERAPVWLDLAREYTECGIINSKSETPSASRVSRNRGSSRRCSTHSCARSRIHTETSMRRTESLSL